MDYEKLARDSLNNAYALRPVANECDQAPIFAQIGVAYAILALKEEVVALREEIKENNHLVRSNGLSVVMF